MYRSMQDMHPTCLVSDQIKLVFREMMEEARVYLTAVKGRRVRGALGSWRLQLYCILSRCSRSKWFSTIALYKSTTPCISFGGQML